MWHYIGTIKNHRFSTTQFLAAAIGVLLVAAGFFVSVSNAQAAEIIVDDQGSGFSKYGTLSYWKDGYVGYNGHVFWTYNGTYAIDNYAKWQPNLAGAGSGTYTVSVYIPSNYANTTNATYTIFHNGITDVRTVNQAIYSNVWVPLGNFYFSAGGNEYVQLVDKTGEAYATKMVGFDAVKWFKAITVPAVETGGVSSVGQTSAILNGNLTSTGGATSQVWFEYGVTSYTNATGKQTQSSTGPFSQFVSLSSNTTYNFRACASNSQGERCGANQTFKTLAPVIELPSVSTGSADNVTQHSAILNGNLTSTGGATSQVWFEYNVLFPWPMVSTSKQSKSSPGSFNQFISDLTPGVTYYFRACASNSAGPFCDNYQSFITQPATPPVIVLPSVSTESASDVAQHSATLNGKLTDTGGEDNQVWFKYGLTTSYGSVTDKQSKSLAGWFSLFSLFSQSISGLQPNTTYNFQACASNSRGEDCGANQTFKTLAPVNKSPSLPTNPNQFKSDGATAISEGGTTTENIVVFKATVSDPDPDNTVKLYVELRQLNEPFTGIEDGGVLSSGFVSSGSVVSLTKSGLIEGQYHWRARAMDSKEAFSGWQEFGTADNVDFEVKTVPLYTQVRSDFPPRPFADEWADLDYADGQASCGRSIGQCGCAITSAVMVLRYYGITDIANGDVNPQTLNDWLNANNGYVGHGITDWLAVARYSGHRIKYDIAKSGDYLNDYVKLDEYLDKNQPVIVKEKRGRGGIDREHFLVIDTKLATTYGVKDPGWYNTKKLNETTNVANKVRGYENGFDGLRLFYPSDGISVNTLSFSLASPAELLITDPLGRKFGKDPMTDTEYNEIPDATYFTESIDDATGELSPSDHENKSLYIENPLDDQYDIQVIGTGDGGYGFTANFTEGDNVIIFNSIDIPISIDTTHQYTIDWEALSQGETAVTLLVDYEGDGVFDKTVTSDDELTQEEFILQTETIAAVMDFDPNTLNLSSQGHFVTTYIELPDGYGFDINNIDIGSILLNDIVPALTEPTQITDKDNNGIPELMIKFDRNEVKNILPLGNDIPVTITGLILHNGEPLDFKDDDTVNVISPPVWIGSGGPAPAPPQATPPELNEEPVEQEEPIEATITFNPQTLNLSSQGQFVTVYIELPDDLDVSQIDTSSVLLNDVVYALPNPTEVGDDDQDGIPDLMVKFNREQVQSILTAGDNIEIKVTGQVYLIDTYLDFRGYDAIAVIQPPQDEEEVSQQGVPEEDENTPEEVPEENGSIQDSNEEVSEENEDTEDSIEVEQENNGDDNPTDE